MGNSILPLPASLRAAPQPDFAIGLWDPANPDDPETMAWSLLVQLLGGTDVDQVNQLIAAALADYSTTAAIMQLLANRLGPAFPAEGQRDGKVARFAGDVLQWQAVANTEQRVLRNVAQPTNGTRQFLIFNGDEPYITKEITVIRPPPARPSITYAFRRLLNTDDMDGMAADQRVLLDTAPSADTVGKLVIEDDGRRVFSTEEIEHLAVPNSFTPANYNADGTDGAYQGVFQATPAPNLYDVGDWHVNGFSHNPRIIVMRSGYKDWDTTSWDNVGGGLDYIGAFPRGTVEEVAPHASANGQVYLDVDDQILRQVTAFVAGNTAAPTEYKRHEFATEDDLDALETQKQAKLPALPVGAIWRGQADGTTAADQWASTFIEAGPSFVAGNTDQRNLYVSIRHPLNAYPDANIISVSVQGGTPNLQAYNPALLQQTFVVGIQATEMNNLSANGHLDIGDYISVNVLLRNGRNGPISFSRIVEVLVVAAPTGGGAAIDETARNLARNAQTTANSKAAVGDRVLQVAATNDTGDADDASRVDHRHGLPLTVAGGLVFDVMDKLGINEGGVQEAMLSTAVRAKLNQAAESGTDQEARDRAAAAQLDTDTVIAVGPDFIHNEAGPRNIDIAIRHPVGAYSDARIMTVAIAGQPVVNVGYDHTVIQQSVMAEVSAVSFRNLWSVTDAIDDGMGGTTNVQRYHVGAYVPVTIELRSGTGPDATSYFYRIIDVLVVADATLGLPDGSLTPVKADVSTALLKKQWRDAFDSSHISLRDNTLPAVANFNVGDVFIMGRDGANTGVAFRDITDPATALTACTAGDVIVLLNAGWTRVGNILTGSPALRQRITDVENSIATTPSPVIIVSNIASFDAAQDRFEDARGNEVTVPDGSVVTLTQAVYDAAVAKVSFIPNPRAIFLTR